MMNMFWFLAMPVVIFVFSSVMDYAAGLSAKNSEKWYSLPAYFAVAVPLALLGILFLVECFVLAVRS